MVQAPRTRINAQEYFQLPEYKQHDLIQLIDGEVVIAMPPILKHQAIVKKILFLLMQMETQQGGVAYVAPTEVRLDAENVVEPDVLYITPDNLSIARQDDKRIMGAPDLVVEVLSPGTARYDRQQKYRAYEKHGVREYWIIDPSHETLEVWTRGSQAQFQRVGAFAAGDTFQSAVLDQAIEVAPFFDL
jgi:Uma2 family endonuclease